MKHKSLLEKELKYLEKTLSVSKRDMLNIIRHFRSDMDKGLAGGSSSLKMIPTYVDRPTGREKGRFVALDLGGTNFRILALELKGSGVSTPPSSMKFTLKESHMTGSAEVLFGFIASCIKKFIKKEGIKLSEEVRLGFTFSFPVVQTGIASGTLLRWTKGFSAKGVIGKDVVRLLKNALIREGIYNIKISALANDTVGTLVARGYEDRNCDVGVIIGTGTNACYVEKISNIKKVKKVYCSAGHMIVNTEWGNFNKLRMTKYDHLVDKSSNNPGSQILEKMVSGMFLGRLVSAILKEMMYGELIFKGTGHGFLSFDDSFKTEHVSLIESDEAKDMAVTASFLRSLGIKGSTLSERQALKRICEIITKRSARISASAIISVVKKIDPGINKRHTIAIDGSVYEKHPKFSGYMVSGIREIVGVKAKNIKTVLAKDGSGRGAAIIAAVACCD